jgi:hypothetical protein
MKGTTKGGQKMANEKRLTAKHYDGKGYYKKCSGVCHLVDLSCDDCVEMEKLVDRLGELEDEAEKTVDAVEVVRCRDCRYYETVEYYPDGTKQVCRLFRRQMQEDGFCSCGERKDNG